MIHLGRLVSFKDNARTRKWTRNFLEDQNWRDLPGLARESEHARRFYTTNFVADLDVRTSRIFEYSDLDVAPGDASNDAQSDK